MKNQKNKPEPINPHLEFNEDRASIEFIMWKWRCDRSMAEEIYELEFGKSLKVHKDEKEVWELFKDEFGCISRHFNL